MKSQVVIERYSKHLTERKAALEQRLREIMTSRVNMHHVPDIRGLLTKIPIQQELLTWILEADETDTPRNAPFGESAGENQNPLDVPRGADGNPVIESSPDNPD